MANQHNSETLARIEKAREHYKTRASRRLKGQSRSDGLIYNVDGTRRTICDTRWLIHLLRVDNPGLLVTLASEFDPKNEDVDL